MKKVDKNINIEILDDKEFDVEVYYRCFISKKVALYPMTIMGSIYKGQTLQQFIRNGFTEYQKEYEKVEIVEVYLDDKF